MPSSRSIRKASRQKTDAALAIAADLRKSQVQLLTYGKPPALSEFGSADVSPVPLALLSRGGVILSASASLFRLLDAAPAEVSHKPLTEFLQQRDHRAMFKLLASCLQTGQTHRVQFSMAVPGKARKNILLVLSTAFLAPPGNASFRAAFVDLDDIEPRDAGPRPPRHNVRLIEAIDGVVWEADYPQRFTFVSPQVQRILGFSPTQWLRDPYFWQNHIVHDDRDRVLQARADAVRKLANHVLEYRMLTADRKTVWVKDSAVVFAGGPGCTRLCGIITDISDLQYARENLKRANETLEAAVQQRTEKMVQSLDAMETLCYGIAHDLKAPIRGLQGFISILAADYHDKFDHDARLYAQRCQRALERMSELIEAILAYGRLNHTLPDLIPIDPRGAVERVLNSLEPDITAAKAKINVQIAMPRVIANPYLLEQIFANLISNSLKFVKPGTRPEISVSATEVMGSTGGPLVSPSNSPASPRRAEAPEQQDRGEVRAPQCIRITVTDNGIGIPPGSAARMFGMFQRLHRPEEYPGTGIGLAIVKRAIELMNGRVGLFSEPAHGSSFWIELPSAP